MVVCTPCTPVSSDGVRLGPLAQVRGLLESEGVALGLSRSGVVGSWGCLWLLNPPVKDRGEDLSVFILESIEDFYLRHD